MDECRDRNVLPRTGPFGEDIKLSSGLGSVISYLEQASSNQSGAMGHWLSHFSGSEEAPETSILLAYCYDSLRAFYEASVLMLMESKLRYEKNDLELQEQFKSAKSKDDLKKEEQLEMKNQDPFSSSPLFRDLGPHLAPLSRCFDSMLPIAVLYKNVLNLDLKL